jgi:hypothetical protein
MEDGAVLQTAVFSTNPQSVFIITANENIPQFARQSDCNFGPLKGEMDLDAAAIERIGAAIQSLRQREHTHGRDSALLRLYRTRDGGFVRVLDDDTAPLTPEMVSS